MRVLLVGAGAGFSTKDVEMGYYEALSDLIGDGLSYYCLDRRIGSAFKWLKHSWKYVHDSDPARKPTWADAVYRGGIEALEMALRYQVDLVFIISGMYLHPDVLILMKRAGLRTALLLTESPYEDERQAKLLPLVDIGFTNERSSVDFLRTHNPNTHYVRHAFSPKRHDPNIHVADWPENWHGHDVVFVGTGFEERINLLSKINWDGIDLGLYGTWGLLPSRHKLRQYIRGGVLTNMQAHELYRRSKIGLNLYRTSETYGTDTSHILEAASMNPRAYELAAAGAFSLTEFRHEGVQTLGDSQPYFYGGNGNLESYIRCFLNYDEERTKRAEKARALVVQQGHTFDNRLREILSYDVS